MANDITHDQAMILLDRAYKKQMRGELGTAIDLYRQSLALHPTAEAHTFLGWTYSMLNRYDEAIEQCEAAIEIDPTFGNPYNDIGAYLIEQDQLSAAIPWLEKALVASRYETPQFALMNLGRVHEQMGHYRTALDYFNQALAINPHYRTALYAKYGLLGAVN